MMDEKIMTDRKPNLMAAAVHDAMRKAERWGVPHRMAAPGESEPAIDIPTASLRTILEAVYRRGVEEALEQAATAHDRTAAECRAAAEEMRGTDPDAARENLWRAEFHAASSRCIRALADREDD